MEFSLDTEQRAIAAMAAQLFASHGSDAHVRQLAEAGITFDAPLWRQMLQAGLFGLCLPEALGGSGLGHLELALVLEQQGRHLAAVPWWAHHLLTLAITQHGTPALQTRLLPGLVDGATPAALVTEVADRTALRATRTASGWLLDGAVAAVPLEQEHVLLLVRAETESGPRVFLVELAAALPSAGPTAHLTRTSGLLTDMSPVHDLHFDALPLAADALLAEATLPWLEEHIDLCVAAQQLGVLGEALRRTAAFTSERQQFGRPLGSFQGLAMRAADAYIDVELLRSTVWQLAWRLDQGLPATAAARVCKQQAAKAGHAVGHTVQHLHGGAGTDLTYPIHRFFLKSQALALTGGGHEAQLARIGRALAGASCEEYLHE